MPRGSILMWHGSLWHGGGANTSSEELSEYIAAELLRGLRDSVPDVRWSRVEVGVEETSGQRGLCILRP